MDKDGVPISSISKYVKISVEEVAKIIIQHFQEQSGGIVLGQLFPNPNIGVVYLQLETPLKASCTLHLYDSSGKEAVSFNLEEGMSYFTQSVSHLAPGMYICKLLEGESVMWNQKLALIKN